MVVVAEIPCGAGCDVVTAPPALHVASSHEWRPSCALSLVILAVAPLLPRTSGLVLGSRVGRASGRGRQLGAAVLCADLQATPLTGRATHTRRCRVTKLATGC